MDSSSDCDDYKKESYISLRKMQLNLVYIPIVIRQRILNDMVNELPESMKRRVKALKKMQFATTQLEAEFYKEVHDLETKYQLLTAPILDKRENIVKGTYEPTNQECDWSLKLPEDISEKISQVPEGILEHLRKPSSTPEETEGLPNFWLTIFKHVPLLSENIEEHDEPLLKYLYDIRTIYHTDPMAFTLEFRFTSNEYFKNPVLTKKYYLICNPNTQDPFRFEGPEISKCEGCQIDWYDGKNITVTQINKKQKHRSTGCLRTIIINIPKDSFFNYFSPPTTVSDDNAEIDLSILQILRNDFEIGHYLRERIIPKAVLYYTGEALEGLVDEPNNEDLLANDEEEDFYGIISENEF